MKKKILKKKNNGFTLIEILIAMTIFGFLVYIITGILISIVQTVYNVNQRSFLRNNLEAITSVISQDMQFATNVDYCSNPPYAANTCIVMTVPSLASGSSINSNVETIYYDSTNKAIMKNVNVNLSSPLTLKLNSSNISIATLTLSLSGGNLLISGTGSIQTGFDKTTTILPISAVIQYGRN